MADVLCAAPEVDGLQGGCSQSLDEGFQRGQLILQDFTDFGGVYHF
jgi:hypothetical protein